MSAQKPLELILARNLLSSISTPAFLVGEEGRLLFYNDAAAALLGRRFEETGAMTVAEWTTAFGPFDEHDKPLPYDEIPLVVAVREGRPAHGIFRIATPAGCEEVAASAIPIVGPSGATGAIVIFWPATDESPTRDVVSASSETGDPR